MSENIIIPEEESGCPLHKEVVTCLRELKNNKRFWGRIFDSKWFFWCLTGMIAGFITFNVWVVGEIYAQKANEVQRKAVTETICDNVKEIKEDVKKQEEKRQKDKDDVMKILLDIQKQIKK